MHNSLKRDGLVCSGSKHYGWSCVSFRVIRPRFSEIINFRNSPAGTRYAHSGHERVPAGAEINCGAEETSGLLNTKTHARASIID
jgi:hypothetical protein